MQIMTILGSVLDRNSLIATHGGVARYEMADDVARRYVFPEIKERLNKAFDYNTVVCDLYISLETFEMIGFRVLDAKKGEDFFFEDVNEIFDISDENRIICILVCQYLGCKAIKEFSF